MVKKMGFKENLLNKIETDRLAHRVIQSLKSPDSGSRFDKAAMRQLLALGKFAPRKERDLELYLLENDAEKKKILVLDNGLAIYHTTIIDVCLRKSPTVKEMLSIRNAIRILNDKDVVVSKKENSVRTVQAMIITSLDLAYTATDIDQIEKEGQAAFESRYTDGVVESLSLFAELLGLRELPRALHIPHHWIRGKTEKDAWAPIVTYGMGDNVLRLIDTPIDPSDDNQVDYFRQAADGRADTAGEGLAVFTFLKNSVPAYQP